MMQDMPKKSGGAMYPQVEVATGSDMTSMPKSVSRPVSTIADKTDYDPSLCAPIQHPAGTTGTN